MTDSSLFCHECGARLPDGAKFCAACGAKVPNAEALVAASVSAAPGATPAPSTAVQPPEAPRVWVDSVNGTRCGECESLLRGQPICPTCGTGNRKVKGEPNERLAHMLTPQPPGAARPLQVVWVRDAGTNGFAIASLVLGLCGLSALAIIFAHVARSQINKHGGGGYGMATAGSVLGWLGILLTLALLGFLFIWETA
ncbi:MAG: DUF4190 domain-containing protein [Bifidobacteriaceae bacterium]|jgi:RNA polymerase subunit RPABC4/transcription elongation factor Spt4|nr:DUF4190 domain-containing protein [Bifidobacteriaceae bacterium]